MKLYHFSNHKIFGKLKTRCFGENYFTERDKQICNIKRIYFYTEQVPEEHFFNGAKYCYVANIRKDFIYDLVKDKQGIGVKYNGDIFKIISWVKRNGYKGLSYTFSYVVVAVFEDVEICKTIGRSV